ncbi:MAG: hypothetical protein HOW73_45910 [Polyangiaceae bacterium]|nr:hypothetical protein [Polyangiaceae bacterium]
MPRSDAASRPSVAAATAVLLLHLGGAAATLTLLPQGFPLSDVHTWTNTVLPIVVALAITAALARSIATKSFGRPAAAIIAAIAGGWTAAAVAGKILFPVSVGWSQVGGFAALSFAFGSLAWRTMRRPLDALLAAGGGATVGAFVMAAQRAPEPRTRPLGGELATVETSEASPDHPQVTAVAIPCAGAHIAFEPLLTFQSRSPDRMWTVLAPPEAFGPRRKMTAFEAAPLGFRARYHDDGESSLVFEESAGAASIEAVSVLPAPVYSHLNSFAVLRFDFEASIAFSPTEPARFDIEQADYPYGRPIQLAVRDGAGTFRVLRASDGDKGPFEERARGTLGDGEPLAIELRYQTAGTERGCRVTFFDWSAQASTALSPTAGFGLPESSIQFFGDGRTSMVVLTLAETGPGAGWSSVGHAAGTYRNKVRVDPL